MSKSDTAEQKRRQESKRKMREWDEAIPNGAFADAIVEENLTGRHVNNNEPSLAGNISSLEY